MYLWYIFIIKCIGIHICLLAKGKGEKERYTHLNAEYRVPKNSKER